ncbi:CinA family protein [Arthrobacter sedimenti]|uniref:CinA family protein n=1 Tax=Arthrobacter sedimenti TaxID=2694931 RepID=UPI000B36475B|nr:CinA family protein [Arthrobacter sedimenti]OUM44371.1 damage-inducible protein CinA [Arthrobacter agilis]
MSDAGAASEVVALAAHLGVTVATAESLTAGLVASSIAGVPGASAVLRGGVVAYQLEVKQKLLGVDADLLAAAGAVDPRVAAAMADGARAAFSADIGLATTGVAGPSPHGGKPVGTVFTAISSSAGTETFEHHFPGDRESIRTASCDAVLTELLGTLSKGTNSGRG